MARRKQASGQKKNAKLVVNLCAYFHVRTRLFCLKTKVGLIQTPIVAVLDSGSGETLIEEELFDKIGGKHTSPMAYKLSSVTHSPIPTVGRGIVIIDIGHGLEEQACIVISKEVVLPTPMVFGLDFMFRKAVTIKPVYLRGVERALQLSFDGSAVQTKPAPDGCIGEFPA